MEPKLVKITMRVRQSWLLFQSYNEVRLYFGLEARYRACAPFCRCQFHWKLRPSGVSLESPGVENIPQVLANRAIVAQNHDARKAVSATLWVLKWSGVIFRPRSSTLSVRSFYLCPFHLKLSHQGLVSSHWDWKISPNFREIEQKRLKIIMRVRRSLLLFQFKMKWGYIST